MARIQGKLGDLFVGAPSTDPQNTTYNTGDSVQVGQMTDWTLDTVGDTIEVTDFDDNWTEFVKTVSRWTATINGFLDPSSTKNQDELFSALIIGDTDMAGTLPTTSGEQEAQLLMTFYIDDNAAAGSKKALFGNVIMGGLSPTVEAAGVITVSGTIQGTGKLGYTASG